MAKKCDSCGGAVEGLLKKTCNSCQAKAADIAAEESLQKRKDDYAASLAAARSTRPDLVDAWEKMHKTENAKWTPDIAKSEQYFRLIHADLVALIPKGETVAAIGCGVTSTSGCTWIVTEKSLVIHEYSILNNSTKASEVANLEMITGIQNKVFTAHNGKKTITVTRAANTDHLSVVHQVIAEELVQALNQGTKGSGASKGGSSNVNDPAAQLRKLKALLDDGIISQKEFDKKKLDLLDKI